MHITLQQQHYWHAAPGKIYIKSAKSRLQEDSDTSWKNEKMTSSPDSYHQRKRQRSNKANAKATAKEKAKATGNPETRSTQDEEKAKENGTRSPSNHSNPSDGPRFM